MIPELDDALAWQNLTHGFGPAGDIPELLRQVRQSPGPRKDHTGEPWAALRARLCHQGEAWEATFAAIPHIIDIALHVPGPIDFSFFQFPAEIEILRHKGVGAPLPDAFKPQYLDAIELLNDCSRHVWWYEWDEAMMLSVLGALAAAKGHHALGEAILNLDEAQIARIKVQARPLRRLRRRARP